MRGMDPEYLDKLDEIQRKWAITGPGKMFLDDFVFLRGNHCFVIGTTGSGKSNKGYWLLNWLKHTENQIWLDTGKSDEILPILCLGKKVHIIVPKYSSVSIEERVNGRWQKIQDHPQVTEISSAGDTWFALKTSWDENNHKSFDTINILCFRNSFWSSDKRAEWMTELFQTMADWTRLRKMPGGVFPFTLHIDESQWVLPGTRMTRDEARTKSAEIITENALEIRSSGGRLVMYAQGFKNIPPAIRENLVCALLCRGADVKSDESRVLYPHCNPDPWVKRPANFRKYEAKFVTEDGRSSPTNRPWQFPLMPKDKEDREWIKHCRVRYTGFHDQPPEIAEPIEECFPDLGRYSAMAIPIEKWVPAFSRSDISGGISNDG